MKITIQEFVQELERLIQEVNHELTKRKAGEPGAGTEDELRCILKELSELKAKAVSGKLPPRNERWLSSAYIVTDTWPYDSQLGEDICGLADLYQRKVE